MKFKNAIGLLIEENKQYILNFLLKYIKQKNIIILESHPDLSGNTFEFYEFMLKNKINTKYKIYWLVENPLDFRKYTIKNVKFIPLKPSDFLKELKKKFIIHSAKLIISENRIIHKTNYNTKSIHLHHGTVLKDISGIYNFGKSYNYILCPSKELVELYKRLFKVNEEQIIICGYPRNDLLIKDNDTLDQLGYSKYSKVILWMPTFRQHKNKERNDSAKALPLGIPVFKNEEQLYNLNDFLKNKNILLVLKLHPAQDKSYLNISATSNIVILEDYQLQKKGIKLYDFIGKTDALITDYSSIYFDYLLIGKPIGLTIDDIDDYSLGFVYSDVEEYLVGDKIKDLNEMKLFIQNCFYGIDNNKALREKVNTKINISTTQTYSEELYKKIKGFL